MSIFISLVIVILAMLIMCSLQLTPGVFAIFYHYALGKFSKAKASDLSLFFILGAEIIAACLFLSIYYLTCVLFFDNLHPENTILAWTLAGILIALGFLSIFIYYRRGPGTKLFIPRKYAKALDLNARAINTRSDAFMLGALAGTCELVFTLPLYFVTSIEIIKMGAEGFSSNLLTIIYILVPVIPLYFIRWKYQTGHTLADIEKSRVKDKHFTRFFLALNYFLIAIFIICFRTIYA